MLNLNVHAHPGKFNDDWFKTQGYTQSAVFEFCLKEFILQTNKGKTIKWLTKKPYNLKNANGKMSRNARFEGYHIFFVNRDNKFFTTVLTFKNLTGVVIVFVF